MNLNYQIISMIGEEIGRGMLNMDTNIKVVFFDLFFTLVTPKYNDLRNEYDVLKLTMEEWEKYAEDEELYLARALGQEKDPEKIIESILEKMKIGYEPCHKADILNLREERMKRCLIEVEKDIVETISELRKNGKKICLISNADVIDVMHWDKSPLSELFDEKIFSYEVGYVKPQTDIYKLALNKMNVESENCVFIGDGGSDELKGAKDIGMKTIMVTHLLKRDEDKHKEIMKFADYHVEKFKDILSLTIL